MEDDIQNPGLVLILHQYLLIFKEIASEASWNGNPQKSLREREAALFY
jgi:hypothetical protein